MIDQLYDRNYQAARAQMNADIGSGLARLARNIRVTLDALHRIEFAAPWRSSGRGPARG